MALGLSVVFHLARTHIFAGDLDLPWIGLDLQERAFVCLLYFYNPKCVERRASQEQ